MTGRNRKKLMPLGVSSSQCLIVYHFIDYICIMFECRSKHIYNESLGGKRSPDFINH